MRAKQRIIEAGVAINGHQPAINAPQANMKGGAKVMECIASGGEKQRVRTVQQAKGETHAETIFFLPPLDKKKSSTEWWKDGKATEEARVAYVAATRPKKAFVLIMHEENWTRVQAARPAVAGAVRVLGSASAAKAQKGLADFL